MNGRRLSALLSFALLGILAAGLVAAQQAKQLPQPSSPGAAIEAAAKAAAADRQQTENSQAQQKTGPVEILSDTQGVDFGPYLQAVIAKVRKNWYSLIPATARSEKGTVVIEFKVHKDGRITDMNLVSRAGLDMDDAAWDSISNAAPLPAFPKGFQRSLLALRCRFYYNLDKSDLK